MNKFHNDLVKFNIKIANHVFSIISEYPLLERLFTDFLTEAHEESEIHINWDDIQVDADELDDNNPTCASHNIQNIKLTIPKIIKEVTEKLISYDIILIHGASISYNNQAIIFSAPSGTGKTTHILKWLDRLPEAFVVNGDKTFISANNDDQALLVFGSPWAGKENMYSNTVVSLKAIVFIEQDYNNNIVPITFSEAFPRLIQQIYRPEDTELTRKTLNTIITFKDRVSFWLFKCNNYKEDCFEVAFNALY